MYRISFIASVFLTVFLSVYLSSCNKTTYVEDVDTTRGIWGQVMLYDEQGNQDVDYSNIMIKVHCIDTIGYDTVNVTVFDTSYAITTDDKGFWEIYKPAGGWYFLEFSKEGFGKNAVYAHQYDTSHADTLDVIPLAKPSQGSVEIDSLSVKDDVLSIYRKVYFTASYPSYSLATWYFFGTDASVSPENYQYAYVSGTSTAKGNSTHETVVYKPLDKLYENGMSEGSTVYVRAYCDNAHAVSYQTGDDTWTFPNIGEGSAVQSFVIPEEESEEE